MGRSSVTIHETWYRNGTGVPNQAARYSVGFWRGNYFTALEGSLRTSFLIRWPGKITPGGVSNEIVHITDILPTFARVAGYKMPVLSKNSSDVKRQ